MEKFLASFRTPEDWLSFISELGIDACFEEIGAVAGLRKKSSEEKTLLQHVSPDRINWYDRRYIADQKKRRGLNFQIVPVTLDVRNFDWARPDCGPRYVGFNVAGRAPEVVEFMKAFLGAARESSYDLRGIHLDAAEFYRGIMIADLTTRTDAVYMGSNFGITQVTHPALKDKAQELARKYELLHMREGELPVTEEIRHILKT